MINEWRPAGNGSGARFSVFGLKDAGAQPVSHGISHFGHKTKSCRKGWTNASIFGSYEQHSLGLGVKLHSSCADHDSASMDIET